MDSVYQRIEESGHVIEVLADDVGLLQALIGSRLLGDDNTHGEFAVRRAYVQAVFALVEAIAEQHSRLLLDMVADGLLSLEPGVADVLRPDTFVALDNGKVKPRANHLPVERKLRVLCRIAGETLGRPILASQDAASWENFRSALRVRNALAHPKCRTIAASNTRLLTSSKIRRIGSSRFTRSS